MHNVPEFKQLFSILEIIIQFGRICLLHRPISLFKKSRCFQIVLSLVLMMIMLYVAADLLKREEPKFYIQTFTLACSGEGA